jgi:hypothetical protein
MLLVLRFRHLNASPLLSDPISFLHFRVHPSDTNAQRKYSTKTLVSCISILYRNMTSQLKITTFANEILDKVFAHLTNKDEWLALCRTYRSFKSSAQQLLFRDIQIPVQHVIGSAGRCFQLSSVLTGASHLIHSVRAIQIDCRLEGAYPYATSSLSDKQSTPSLPDFQAYSI